MNVVISRALPVAISLALIVGVHGTEILATAQPSPQTGCHDCGCASECSCRGPVKGCACNSKGPSIKTNCNCGCSGTIHLGGISSWESVFAGTCGLNRPLLVWSTPPGLGDSEAWRLAFEHEHPPRLLS